MTTTGRSPFIWVRSETGWHGTPKAAPVPAWPAQGSEAQVGAMQNEGPDPTLGRGHRAYGEWLALIQPEGYHKCP